MIGEIILLLGWVVVVVVSYKVAVKVLEKAGEI